MSSPVTFTLTTGNQVNVDDVGLRVMTPSGEQVAAYTFAEIRGVNLAGGDVVIDTHTRGTVTLTADPDTASALSVVVSSRLVQLSPVNSGGGSRPPIAPAMTPTPNPPPPPTQIIVQRGGHGCLVTGLWFIFVGWWLSGIWILIAWILNVTVIGMPLGLMMINKLPKIVSLRPETSEFVIDAGVLRETKQAQHPIILRIIYFVLVGWWASGIWMSLAWLASVTIIGLPLAIWMYNRVPGVTTLRRY